MSGKIVKTDAEWRARLTPLQYNVTRRRGTERAYSGEYCGHRAAGLYACVCCGHKLFSSEDKLDDGSGWPSFRAATASDPILLGTDNSWMCASTEALCARCEAHLGHLLEAPEGRRFCVNSASLKFQPR